MRCSTSYKDELDRNLDEKLVADSSLLFSVIEIRCQDMYHDKLSADIYSVHLRQKVHFMCLQSADEVLMTQEFLFLDAAFFAGLNCNVKKKKKKKKKKNEYKAIGKRNIQTCRIYTS